MRGPIAALIFFSTLSTIRADDPPTEPAATATDTATEDTTPAAPPVPVQTISIDEIQALVKRAVDSTALDESQKDAALSQLREAKGKLEELQTWKERAESFRKRIENAPQELERLKQPDPTTMPTSQPASAQPATTQPTTTSAPTTQAAFDTSTLEGMEASLRAEQAKLDAEIARLQAADDSIARRGTFLTDGPKQITSAREELIQLQKEPAKSDAPELLTLARLANRTATRMLLEQKVAALELEQEFYDGFGDLLVMQRDRAVQRRDALDASVKQSRLRVAALRQLAAEQAKEKAEDVSTRVRRLLPSIVTLIEENKQIADDLAKLSTESAEQVAAVEAAAAVLTRVQNEFNEITKKGENARNSQSFGILLRNRRANLPDVDYFRRRRNEWQAKSAEANLKSFDYQSKRNELANIEPLVNEMMSAVPSNVSNADRTAIENEVRQQYKLYKDNIDKLLPAYQTYVSDLNTIDTTLAELIRKTEEFGAYIDERILWVRSGRPMGEDRFRGLGSALAWFLNSDHWGAFLNAAAAYYARHWYLLLPGFLVVGALFACSRLFNRKLREYAVEANAPLSVNFRVTLASTLFTILFALPYPLLLWFIGEGFSRVPTSGDFAMAVAKGFRSAAVTLLPIALLFRISRQQGLAGAHLNWHDQSISVIRRNLIWFGPAMTVVGFVVALLSDQDVETHRETLGRDVFMLGMIFIAILAARVLRPTGGALSKYMVERPRSKLTRLRYIWYSIAIAIPVSLAIAAALGYYYTALRLSSRLWITAIFWGTGAILYMLLTRWLLVARRKIAIDQATKKRAETQAKAEAERAARRAAAKGENAEAAQTPPTPVETPPINIPNLSQQTRQLVSTVMIVSLALLTFWVWSRDLPALAILRQFEVGWGVTAADVGMAVLAAVMSVVAIRNIPALLEMTVLSHLPIDAGARYAISAISRYTLGTIGIIVTFSLLGIGWGKLQWLVAAVSVGLGFGLQEIFANFVSGLIILFERPIRVGDTVTVGSDSGTVSRIQIRATTIVDWNNKERVIPNKQFVTNEITNWTLSNQITRLVIPVGVAYHSDPRKVRDILMKVLLANPKVLDEPKPRVYFVGFGDSALSFECRAFYKDIEDWLQARHSLHVDILEACAQHGIEIAFPQRDIHIRSIKADLPIKQVTTGDDEPKAIPLD